MSWRVVRVAFPVQAGALRIGGLGGRRRPRACPTIFLEPRTTNTLVRSRKNTHGVCGRREEDAEKPRRPVFGSFGTLGSTGLAACAPSIDTSTHYGCQKLVTLPAAEEATFACNEDAGLQPPMIRTASSGIGRRLRAPRHCQRLEYLPSDDRNEAIHPDPFTPARYSKPVSRSPVDAIPYR